MKVPSEALAFGQTAQELEAEGKPGWRVPRRVRDTDHPSKPLLVLGLCRRSPRVWIALRAGSVLTRGVISGSDVFDRSGVEPGEVPARQILGEAECEAKAALLPLRADDIYAQTDHRNLRIVSKTEAQRRYGVSARAVEAFYETDADQFLGDHLEA